MAEGRKRSGIPCRTEDTFPEDRNHHDALVPCLANFELNVLDSHTSASDKASLTKKETRFRWPGLGWGPKICNPHSAEAK